MIKYLCNIRLLSNLLLFLVCSCQQSPPQHIEQRPDGITAFTGEAMTMNYSILIGQALDNKQEEMISKTIAATFQEVNDIYNKWNPESELSHLNRLSAHQVVTISPSLENLLKDTQRIVELSEGRFDPTVEPLEQLWKNKLKNQTIPSSEELQSIANQIGWNKIHFGNGVFYKDHENVQLDLGGIAKGLCIDLLVERLNQQGYSNLFVEWGGEIKTTGVHPRGRPWTIFISRLGNDHPEDAVATLLLENQAIATSGDYMQFWTLSQKDEKGIDKIITYFHIFDPHTLKPLEITHTSIASTSVVASTCAFADGLATTAMLFGSVEEAKAWSERIKEKYPDTSFWFVTRSGH